MVTKEIIEDSEKRYKFIISKNLVLYYIILCPKIHYDVLGFSRPCNVFELLDLIGSEKKTDNYLKNEISKYCLSYIPLGKIHNAKKKIKLTFSMIAKYPWYKLANSLKEESFKHPVILELFHNTYVPIEGKHRIGASTLVFDLSYKIPSLVVIRDELYTIKMYKKSHPNPFCVEGKKTYKAK